LYVVSGIPPPRADDKYANATVARLRRSDCERRDTRQL
jgi:hypothetical protein